MEIFTSKTFTRSLMVQLVWINIIEAFTERPFWKVDHLAVIWQFCWEKQNKSLIINFSYTSYRFCSHSPPLPLHLLWSDDCMNFDSGYLLFMIRWDEDMTSWSLGMKDKIVKLFYQGSIDVIWTNYYQTNSLVCKSQQKDFGHSLYLSNWEVVLKARGKEWISFRNETKVNQLLF